MAAISRQPADPCIRREWSDKPGFWDPLAVVQVCIPILAREVYPNMNAIHNAKPNALHPMMKMCIDDVCKGIAMYLNAWCEEESIEQAVHRYIYYPCRMELIECVREKPERALAFLLTYLKLRGPFFIWLRRNVSDRCISSAAQQYLTNLSDLDHSAAIYIGRHLKYILTVANGQNIHYMKGVLSKVWGPLFLSVENDLTMSAPLDECSKVRYSTELFSRMLDIVSWNSMSPFEGAARGFRQDRHERLIRYENVRGQFVKDQLQEPTSLNGCSLGDMMHSSALHQALTADNNRKANPLQAVFTSGDTETSKRIPSKPSVPFPPDRCQLNYGPSITRI